MAKNVTLLNRFHNTKSWFVFHVAGCLLTWILADTICVPYLRMTLGTQCQQGQKWLKKWRPSNTILFRAAHTYLVHIREYPPHSPQTKLTTNFTKLESTEIVMPSFHLIPHPTILSNNYLISILFFVKVFLVNQKMLPNWKCKMIVTNLH